VTAEAAGEVGEEHADDGGCVVEEKLPPSPMRRSNRTALALPLFGALGCPEMSQKCPERWTLMAHLEKFRVSSLSKTRLEQVTAQQDVTHYTTIKKLMSTLNLSSNLP
jgi:hypothetical protein